MPVKFKSEVSLDALNNATTDTDKFLVSDSGIVKYRTGTQLLSDLGVSGLYVPYTGATGNVDLGIHTLSSYNLIVNHTSGSGVAASITKGGNGEALTINKSSGSGNAMSVIGGLTSLVDLTLSSIPNATIDTDRFIVSDGGAIKYRTGAEVLSDIGAQAALTNPVTGIGTLNFVSKFTSTGSTLGDSQIFDNGTNVGIGTTNPDTLLHISSLNSSILRLESTNTALGLDAVVGEIQFEANDASSTGTGVKAKIGAYSEIASGNSVGLRFFTSAAGISTGTERMRITSTGNVGIGTSSPTAKLTLSDVVETKFDITDTSGHSKRFFVRNLDKTLAIYNNDAGQQRTQLRLVTGAAASSDRLSLLEAGGNVGIGTTSPSEKLVVGGSSGGSTTPTAIRLDDTYRTGGDAFDKLKFYLYKSLTETYGFGLGDLGDIQYWAGTNSTGTHRFFTSKTERMRIASSGNVGIGTTSPIHKLSVNGKIGGDIFGDSHIEFLSNGNTSLKANNSVLIGYSQSTVVTQSGNVGIGTTSPSTKLQVNGDIASVMTGPAGNTGMYKFGDGSTFILGATTSPFTSGFISFELGYSEKMRITSNGNVGIGTSSPEACALLHVDTREKGFLPPRMDTSQRDNISSPVEGLIIWNYDTRTIEVYDGSNWQRVAYV